MYELLSEEFWDSQAIDLKASGELGVAYGNRKIQEYHNEIVSIKLWIHSQDLFKEFKPQSFGDNLSLKN